LHGIITHILLSSIRLSLYKSYSPILFNICREFILLFFFVALFNARYCRCLSQMNPLYGVLVVVVVAVVCVVLTKLHYYVLTGSCPAHSSQLTTHTIHNSQLDVASATCL